MTAQQYAKKLNDTVQGLTTGLSEKMQVWVASDVIGEVQRRIQSTGELSDGDKGQYSTKSALVGYPSSGIQQNYSAMYKRAYNALKKQAAAKWVTVSGHRLVEAPGGYKQIRELGGLDTNFKDYTISGDMFRSVKVRKNAHTPTTVSVTYGSQGKNEKILESHNERAGQNILLPNKDEMKRLELRIIKWIVAELRQANNG